MNNHSDSSPRILFVDDEATSLKYFRKLIGELVPVAVAGSAEEGRQVLDAHADTLLVLVSDQRMPGEQGNALLRYARERHPGIVRILTTAYAELDRTVEAVNDGQIHRYIKKPWDLATLKMELVQALDFAELRRDRDRLLREKMMVRSRQILAHRIGSLHALCIQLRGAARINPMHAYLSAARAAGVRPAEPDWLQHDYADIVAAEAERHGPFAKAVQAELDKLHDHLPAPSAQAALAILAELGSVVERMADGALMLPLTHWPVAEYLASSKEVSNTHAAWFASQLWLDEHELALDIEPAEDGMLCRIVPATGAAAVNVPTWIEQFMIE